MKNELKITKDEMLSWVKKYYFEGAGNKILFALYLLLGLVGVALMILVLHGGGDTLSGAIGIASIVISVYKLFFERKVFMLRRYRMLAKTYGVDEWQRSIEFTDDDILLNDHNSVSRFRYESIRKIKDEGKIVIIVLNNNIALRFYKDSFTAGTWQECQAMLESKMK